MSDEVREAMHRLKRWIGKERARYVRIANSLGDNAYGSDRARGEINVCDLIMGKINADLRKRAKRGEVDE